jgi:hypothetical protein
VHSYGLNLWNVYRRFSVDIVGGESDLHRSATLRASDGFHVETKAQGVGN